MARTVFIIQTTPDAKLPIIQGLIREFQQAGYNEVPYNNEYAVYKKGTGMMQAMQFVKIADENNTILVYGWVCAGIAEATMKEMDLKGFVGCIPKRGLEKMLYNAFAKVGIQKETIKTSVLK